MPQRRPPDCLHHRAFADAASAAPSSPAAGRPARGLALATLAAVDVWLAAELLEAIGAVLAQRDAPLLPLLAAIGTAMPAGAALLLTWLLIEDLTGTGAEVFS